MTVDLVDIVLIQELTHVYNFQQVGSKTVLGKGNLE